MADFAINFSLSLVEQIINLTLNGQQDQGNVAGADISKVRAHLEAMLTIVQSREANEAIVGRLQSVSYDIDEVLGDIMLNEPHYSPPDGVVKTIYAFFHNTRLIGSFKKIREKIQKIQQDMNSISKDLLPQSVPCQVQRNNVQHLLPQPLQEAEILGIHGTKENLISQLISNTGKQCSVIVVVGPPGSGKTVLANSVYRDSRVRRRFDIQVCACISPRFDVDYVLGLFKSQASGCNETGNLANDLKNRLRGKRYLVLLDDVWSENQWRDIRLALPDDSNGSRVVITSTKMDVAAFSSIAAMSSHIHLVDGLKEQESWELFCKKAFPQENGVCPQGLVNLSRDIMHKCEGCPLAISAVANLLAGKQQRLESEWTRVRNSLGYEMKSNTLFTDLNNSIQQCYDDLSANLRSCLLYFSLFPQGHYIERARLIRLWVAERFVNETREKTGEDIAEEYLNELIRRHLVVANTDFDNRVKNCSVRNFLHYFLTNKSENEDFAAMLDKTSTKPKENVRRLSVTDSTSWPMIRVCTFLTLGICSPQIIRLISQFKYLKVLDFQGAPLHYFPSCVLDLGLLRYLSLRGSPISEIPSSIKRLRYLEFLDLKHTFITHLPKQICLLHKLRHLLVYHYLQSCYATFDTATGMKMTGEIGSLSCMQKLTLLSATKHKNLYDQLGRLTRLQKLGLIDIRESDGKSLCESLSKMKHLSVLDLRSLDSSESLDLDHPEGPQLPCKMLQRVYLKGGLKKLPGWVMSLTSLVRLHLRWSRLKTSPINELQGLEKLIELCLADAFIGDKLEFGRDAFKSLKVLQLEELEELSKVEASRGSLHKLEKLTLCNCAKLKTLPPQIERLPELKRLVMYDMPVELTNKLCKGTTDRSKIKVYVSDAAKRTWIEQNLF